MKTFTDFWASVYDKVIHTDILRVAEGAWNDGWREGSKQVRIEDNGIIEFYKTQVEDLRLKTHARFNNEECWIWQDDGQDFEESLVCPVVISANQLRELLEHRERSRKIDYLADCAYNELDNAELAGKGYATKIYDLIKNIEVI